MSRLYIFSFKFEKMVALICTIFISITSLGWIVKFALYPDPRVKLVGFTVLGIAALAPVLLFFLKEELRFKVSMSFIGCLIGLYGFEYYLELKENHFDNRRKEENKGTSEIYEKLKSEGKPTSIAAASLSVYKKLGGKNGKVLSSKGELLPLSNVSNSYLILCEGEDGPIVFKSDQYGFNNEQSVWDRNEFEVAMVGDSFAKGVCVNREDNLMSSVVKKYPNSVNLGIVGHGPLAMLGSIKEYLAILKPKKVLWCYVSNDLYPNLYLEKANEALANYLKKDFTQGLIDRQAEVDEVVLKYISPGGSTAKKVNETPKQSFLQKAKSFANSKFIKLYRLRQKVLRPYLSKLNSDIDLFERILSQSNEIVHGWGGELIFVYLPVSHRFYKKQLDPQKEKIFTLVEKLGIRIVDIESVFLKSKDAKKLFEDANSHYNKEGYRMASEAILKLLDE